MKASLVLCLASLACMTTALPPPAAPAGSPPSPAMIQSFIPSPEEIAALQALHTTPAPTAGAATGTVGPTAPPTMPPAVANLVKKYQAAAAAFAPMVPAV